MTSLKSMSGAVFCDKAPLVRMVRCRTVAKTGTGTPGLRHPEPPGDSRGTELLLGTETADLGRVDPGLAPRVNAPILGRRDPLHMLLSSEVGLELSKDAQHTEQGFAGGCGGVHRLLRGLKRHAPHGCASECEVGRAA
jgi:hypothetical protein